MAEERSDVTSENLPEQADQMTIPADVDSVLGLISSMINYFQNLPHMKEACQAITDLKSLLEQRGKPLTAQEDSGLQSLQDVLLNESRLAAKWKRLRLLLEPSTFAENLRNTFRDIRDSFNKLQVSSKGNIVEQLEKVIEDLSDGGHLIIELNRAETEFKKQFLVFHRENRSKSPTSEDAISVRAWLAKQLGTDVDSIGQELKEIKKSEGTFLEELIVYVTELEERECTVELAAESPGEGGEPSDTDFIEPLDVIARDGVHALGSTNMARVLEGFDHLMECTKLPGGKLEVYKARVQSKGSKQEYEATAIGEAIRLAKAEDELYVEQAMKLLEALTSSRGGVAVASERRKIYIGVSDHVEVLIKLMKAKRHPEARLLAAETVINILVNRSVWQMVRRKYEVVSALVAISNEHAADQSIHNLNRADRVCLLGLTRLTEFSRGGNLKINSARDRTQIIVTALMKLLREGLRDDGEANLAKDSLVALDTQVLVMDHSPPTHVVCLLVRKHMSELMVTKGLVLHSSVPGRMAIISIMTKLCGLHKEDITEDLFLYLLKMMKRTGDEILNLQEMGQDVKDLNKLLSLSVKLLCFCVTHGKNTALSVLTKNVAERRTLQEMLDRHDSGILDESKLEIMYILDQIDKQSSQAATVFATLVKMANSSSPACRERVASRLRKCIEEQQDENGITEMKKAGVIDALMKLLKEENENCQQDALLSLYALSPSIPFQTDQLPLQTILGFLSPKCRIEVRDAAVGLLDLMVKENPVNAKKFMERPGALENTLSWLDESPGSASSQKSASALLKMATEVDDSVRLGIANAGLDILVKYVQDGQDGKFKEMLTETLGLICKSGKSSDKEAVTKGRGHIFLVTSLRENCLREIAAQGLLDLIRNESTQGDVLQSEFVTTALGSIDLRFASTDIAIGLATICSTSEGLDQIYASTRSVPALLILLEHCPKLAGKGSAAAVIAKLYPRLNRKEDLKRQAEMTEACRHLIKYLELDDKSQLKWFRDDKSQLMWFLKALAAFATGRKGRKMIHEERGQKPLIKYLKNKEIDNEVQDLMLKILVEMSYVITERGETRDASYHKILNLFLDLKIAELLCELPKSEVFNQNTESMKNLLILIRNLSLAGEVAVTQLLEHHAVDMLLKVLKQHEHETSLSTVTELAVKALEKFMEESSGKQAFLRGGGILLLVTVLKLDAPSDVRHFTTIILTSVAKDPDTRRTACELIFSYDILPALNTIMYEGETSRMKWQAAVLMKLLAMYGPTSRVCSAMKLKGCLDALSQLRDAQHCKEMANDVLKFVREKNKDCKKVIDSWTNPR